MSRQYRQTITFTLKSVLAPTHWTSTHNQIWGKKKNPHHGSLWQHSLRRVTLPVPRRIRIHPVARLLVDWTCLSAWHQQQQWRVCWAHRGHSVSHYPDDFLMAVWLDSARDDMPLSRSVGLCLCAILIHFLPLRRAVTLPRGQNSPP